MEPTTMKGDARNAAALAAAAGEAAPLAEWTTTSSGTLVATPDGTLHLLNPRSGGGFDYYRFDSKTSTWLGPLASAGSMGNIDSPVVFLANTRAGCLDATFREVTENRDVPTADGVSGRLIHTFSSPYGSVSAFPWGESRTELKDARDIIGTPGVCPWGAGHSGLEVVAPVADGGLRHWWRNDDGTWEVGTVRIRTKDDPNRKFKSCAIVRGYNYKLDILTLDQDGCIWHFGRGAHDKDWTGGRNVGSGFIGTPALVESARTGAEYDLVVPLAGGQIAHYSLSGEWKLAAPIKFGGANKYRGIGLAWSANRLDVVAQTNYGTVEHHRFNGTTWTAGAPLPAPPDPVQNGDWKVKFDTKVIGVHGAVLHTREVLLVGVADDDEAQARGALLDLDKATVKPLARVPHVFCGGHAFLGNGDLLIAGGHTGHDDMLHIFAKTATGWEFREQQPKLFGGRWYPTCTTLPDGRVLILSGKTLATGKINNSYEIFDPKSPTTRRRYDLAEEVKGSFCADLDTIDMYPFVYVLPNGQLFVHSRYTTRFFHLPSAAKGSWSDPVNAKVKMSRTYPWEGASVLLPLQPDVAGNYSAARVAMFGGAGKDATIDTPACNSVEVMETLGSDPQWAFSRQRLLQGRVMPDAVLLPDGKVLVVSGSRTGLGGNAARQPELSAELYDPDAQSFLRLAPMHTPRLYHASAALLPDATVLVAGKCKVFNPDPYRYPEHRGEVFTPPYLQTRHPRPVVAAAPSTIERAGEEIEIEVGGVAPADIKHAMLIRPSTATHSTNMDQRAVVLKPHAVRGRKIVTRTPRTNWVVPPGHYMLFLVSHAGVPSNSTFVQVKILLG